MIDKSSKMSASMERDIKQGGPIEADHVIGDMLRRARHHGIAAPNLEVVWTNLQCYELSR